MAFDNTDPANLQSLQDEVLIDPISMGYAGLPFTDNKKLIEALNNHEANVELPKPTAGAAFNHETLMKTWVPKGITNEMLPWVEALTREAGDITIYEAKYRADCGADSLAALNALTVPLSRAETLYGQGTVLTQQDWILSRDHVGA